MTTDIDELIEELEKERARIAAYYYNYAQIDKDLFYQLLSIFQEYKGLKEERDKLKTVMMAAAVEIAEHWKDHCDKDGYGPVNLLRRLQKGLTDGGYAYTADDWIRLRAQNAKLVENNNELIDFAIWMTGCEYDFCQHKYFCEQRDKLLKGQALQEKVNE